MQKLSFRYLFVLIAQAFATLFAVAAHAGPIVTEAGDAKFLAVADLAAREALREVKQVDLQKNPELKETHRKLIAMVENLLIPEDGNRPIRLVFVDDVTPNAAFLATTKGDRVVMVNLGILKLAKSDDEIAYVLGHELEHGLSVLNGKRSTEAAGRAHVKDALGYIKLGLGERVAENEVDVKSIFRRVHKKGYNPYAAVGFMQRMIENFGDDYGPTHTMMSNRVNTAEIELTGMSRVIGEKMSTTNSNKIVTPQIQSFLSSKELIARRKAEFMEAMGSYKAKSKELVTAIDRLGSVPSSDLKVAQKKVIEDAQALMQDFMQKSEGLGAQLADLIPAEEMLDIKLRHQADFAATLFGDVKAKFGATPKLANMAQFEVLTAVLDTDLFKSELSPGHQDTPLGAIDESIEIEIKYGGRSVSEKRSREITIQRKVDELKKRKQLLLTGFSDPAKAQRISEEAMGLIEMGLRIPPEFRVKQQEYARLQKHIGPWLEEKARLSMEVKRTSSDLLLADTMGDGFERAVSSYYALSKSEKRAFFAKLFESHLANIQRELKEAKSPAAAEAMLKDSLEKFFGYNNYDRMKSDGYGLEDYVREQPAKFQAQMKRLYNAVLDRAPSQAVVASLFGHPANESGRVMMYSSSFGGPAQLSMTPELSDMIVDDKMRQKMIGVQFNLQKRSLLANAKYENVSEYFAKVDPYFSSIEKQVRSGQMDQATMQTAAFKSQLRQTVGIANDRIPAEFRGIAQKYPDLMSDLMHLRYLESSDLNFATKSNPDARASIDRVLKAINDAKRDKKLAKFIDGTIDFDNLMKLSRNTGHKQKEVVKAVASNAHLFSKTKKRVLLTSGEAKRFIEDRTALLNEAWGAGTRGTGLKSALEVGIAYPDLDALTRDVSRGVYAAKDNLAQTFLTARIQELYEKNGKLQGSARFKAVFDEVFKEFPTWNADMLENTLKDMEIRGRKVDRINFVMGYAEAMESQSFARDGKGLTEQTRGHLDSVFDRVVGRLDTVDSVKGKTIDEKFALFKFRTQVSRPEPFVDILFDELWAKKDTNPEIRKLLSDTATVQKLYYDSTKRKLAVWQVDEKHKIATARSALKSGREKIPGVRQERAILSDVQKTIDAQFPTNSHTKDTVINHVEEALQTSQAESRILNKSRLNFDNWHEVPELVLADVPDVISSRMQSSYDRKQLLEYLIGTRQNLPEFTDRTDEMYRTKLKDSLKDFRGRFAQAPPVVRAAMIQPLFDRNHGILAEKEMSEDIYKLILGEKYNEPVVRRLFETYLESAPEAEKKVILSHIMSSFVDAPVGTKGAPLKTVLEAMGPFGIKAGQFLHTSGLLPPNLSTELKGFLDNALPPSRSRVIGDLEKALGPELRGVVSIGDRKGSGSINYVQAVTAKVDGKDVQAVARIRRPYIEGIVGNENGIWETVIGKMRASGDVTEANVADVLDETRKQAYSTLQTGGAELNLAIERDNYSAAEAAYGKKFSGGRLDGFTMGAAKPDDRLQKLVGSDHQNVFSFYEKIDHVPLEKIDDPVLRAEIAKQITTAELDALFKKGVFDPDGHPGNWLVDLKNRRIVRIDYAQLRTVSDKERNAFRTVFAALVDKSPDFRSPKNVKALAQLLEISDKSADLESAIRAAAEKIKWASGGPQEKLFQLRREIQSKLATNGKAQVNMGETLRNGFASLGKISAYKDNMPLKDFYNLFGEYSNVSPTLVKLAIWKEKVVDNWRNLISRRTPARPVAQPATVVNEGKLSQLAVVAEHAVPNPKAKGLRSVPTAPQSDAAITQAANGKINEMVGGSPAPKFAKIPSMEKWDPKPGEVYSVTPAMFESLPDGSELYSAFDKNKKYIKGVDYIDGDTRGGRMAFGIRAEDYQKGGGPKIADVKFGPPTGLNLDNNPYHTGPHGLRVLVLSQAEYDRVPNGTVLFDTDGKRFVKGAVEHPIKLKDGFLNIGFPDIAQAGFEKFGAHGCALDFANLGRKSN